MTRHLGESDANQAGSWDEQTAARCDRCERWYAVPDNDGCPYCDCDEDTGAAEGDEE